MGRQGSVHKAYSAGDPGIGSFLKHLHWPNARDAVRTGRPSRLQGQFQETPGKRTVRPTLCREDTVQTFP